ncbi:MAG: RNA polymerase sigma factor [Planctomycetota bacterium]|jgi:RNA polymerase sigma-70 factor (ECF subfamily)
MINKVNYLELVRQAQLGSQESMNRLARLAQGRVCAYIYRLTLDNVLAQDLSQETLLEMVKSLERLRFEHANQFWSWLYRTALGKVRRHFRARRSKGTVQMSAVADKHFLACSSGDYGDGLSHMIHKELSEAIFEAIGKLKFRHRNVLVLRCFEQRSYSEIATIMNCSEMAAQALFFRAKHSLKRQLSKHGFGKGLLLIALGLFGRLTTPAEAAPASSVTAASMKVGPVAALVGAAGSKLGIAVGTAITVTALTVGGITAMHDKTTEIPNGPTNNGAVLGNGEIEYPYQLVDAYDPDGDGWQGIRANEVLLAKIAPKKWLVGPPASERSWIVLPVDHWVELKFRGEIVNGPGYDVILVELDASGEEADVFITDGAGSEYLLGTARAGTSGQPGRTEIGFDIFDISLPFVPRAVRIVGIKEGGWTHGFDLGSVRARVYVNEEDF